MYAKHIRCRWSSGCFSSPSGHKNHERVSLIYNEIWNYWNTAKGNLARISIRTLYTIRDEFVRSPYQNAQFWGIE